MKPFWGFGSPEKGFRSDLEAVVKSTARAASSETKIQESRVASWRHLEVLPNTGSCYFSCVIAYIVQLTLGFQYRGGLSLSALEGLHTQSLP